MLGGQVQDKIACLFETEFNEELKENLATGGLRSEVNHLYTSCPLIVKTTVKFDGTCSLIRDGTLWRRYDMKLNKAGQAENRRLQKLIKTKGKDAVELKFDLKKHFKSPPQGWIPADAHVETVNQQYHNSQHCVGWVPISATDNADAWHASTIVNNGTQFLFLRADEIDSAKLVPMAIDVNHPELQNKTVELIGSKINRNTLLFPPNERQHFLIGHGSVELPRTEVEKFMPDVNDLRTIDVEKLKQWFNDDSIEINKIEGLVWHVFNTSGELLKIYKVHRNHLGLKWPIDEPTAYRFQTTYIPFI